MKLKIEQMTSEMQNADKKVIEITKEIEQLNLPFREEMVGEKLCLVNNCKKHKIGNLIDLSETSEDRSLINNQPRNRTRIDLEIKM